MIRINLLVTERKTDGKKGKASAAGASGGGGFQTAYLFLGLFSIVGLLIGLAGWYLKDLEIKRLDAEIQVAEKRQRDLQVIKKQVEEFQAKERLLTEKVNLIERLRAEQANGVHMVDEISKALPDFVWLTGMDQTGAQIKFQGQSNSLASVADFIMNLQKAGDASAGGKWFPRVELDSSTEQNNVVTFQVTASFENPEVAAKARAAAAAPAPAAPAAQPPKKS